MLSVNALLMCQDRHKKGLKLIFMCDDFMKNIDSRSLKDKSDIGFNNIIIIYKNKFSCYFMKSYFNP